MTASNDALRYALLHPRAHDTLRWLRYRDVYVPSHTLDHTACAVHVVDVTLTPRALRLRELSSPPYTHVTKNSLRNQSADSDDECSNSSGSSRTTCSSNSHSCSTHNMSRSSHTNKDRSRSSTHHHHHHHHHHHIAVPDARVRTDEELATDHAAVAVALSGLWVTVQLYHLAEPLTSATGSDLSAAQPIHLYPRDSRYPTRRTPQGCHPNQPRCNCSSPNEMTCDNETNADDWNGAAAGDTDSEAGVHAPHTCSLLTAPAFVLAIDERLTLSLTLADAPRDSRIVLRVRRAPSGRVLAETSICLFDRNGELQVGGPRSYPLFAPGRRRARALQERMPCACQDTSVCWTQCDDPYDDVQVCDAALPDWLVGHAHHDDMHHRVRAGVHDTNTTIVQGLEEVCPAAKALCYTPPAWELFARDWHQGRLPRIGWLDALTMPHLDRLAQRQYEHRVRRLVRMRADTEVSRKSYRDTQADALASRGRVAAITPGGAHRCDVSHANVHVIPPGATGRDAHTAHVHANEQTDRPTVVPAPRTTQSPIDTSIETQTNTRVCVGFIRIVMPYSGCSGTPIYHHDLSAACDAGVSRGVASSVSMGAGGIAHNATRLQAPEPPPALQQATCEKMAPSANHHPPRRCEDACDGCTPSPRTTPYAATVTRPFVDHEASETRRRSSIAWASALLPAEALSSLCPHHSPARLAMRQNRCHSSCSAVDTSSSSSSCSSSYSYSSSHSSSSLSFSSLPNVHTGATNNTTASTAEPYAPPVVCSTRTPSRVQHHHHRRHRRHTRPSHGAPCTMMDLQPRADALEPSWHMTRTRIARRPPLSRQRMTPAEAASVWRQRQRGRHDGRLHMVLLQAMRVRRPGQRAALYELQRWTCVGLAEVLFALSAMFAGCGWVRGWAVGQLANRGEAVLCRCVPQLVQAMRYETRTNLQGERYALDDEDDVDWPNDEDDEGTNEDVTCAESRTSRVRGAAKGVKGGDTNRVDACDANEAVRQTTPSAEANAATRNMTQQPHSALADFCCTHALQHWEFCCTFYWCLRVEAGLEEEGLPARSISSSSSSSTPLPRESLSGGLVGAVPADAVPSHRQQQQQQQQQQQHTDMEDEEELAVCPPPPSSAAVWWRTLRGQHRRLCAALRQRRPDFYARLQRQQQLRRCVERLTSRLGEGHADRATQIRRGQELLEARECGLRELLFASAGVPASSSCAWSDGGDGRCRDGFLDAVGTVTLPSHPFVSVHGCTSGQFYVFKSAKRPLLLPWVVSYHVGDVGVPRRERDAGKGKSCASGAHTGNEGDVVTDIASEDTSEHTHNYDDNVGNNMDDGNDDIDTIIETNDRLGARRAAFHTLPPPTPQEEQQSCHEAAADTTFSRLDAHTHVTAVCSAATFVPVALTPPAPHTRRSRTTLPTPDFSRCDGASSYRHEPTNRTGYLHCAPDSEITTTDANTTHGCRTPAAPLPSSLPSSLPVFSLAMMYKSDDDVRQDQLVLQLLDMFDIVTRRNGLDLCLTPYRVLATGAMEGWVELVPHVVTFQSVQREAVRFLREHNATPAAMQAALDRYTRSFAGYSVFTFVLGIGDRHLENILLARDGRLIHVDFGYILGNDPKPFPPPMKVTREMVEVLGGPQSPGYVAFKSYCCSAYHILREHASLWLTMLLMMSHASAMPQVTGSAGVSALVQMMKVQDKLRLDLTNAQATQYLQTVIADSVGSIFTNLWDVLHAAAQAARA